MNFYYKISKIRFWYFKYLSKVHSYLPSACPHWNVIKIDVWWSISLRQSFLQPYESSKRDCAESYYLLIVFGSGVLLLFIQSSQPRLSPRVRAGSAHRFVCCTLPAGVISEGNTVLLYSGCCWCLFFSGNKVLCHKRLKTILTVTICHAVKQRTNHVSLSSKAWENVLLLVRSRFICLIRPNRGLAVKYLPFWDNGEQKLPSELSHRVQRPLKSWREESTCRKWDIIHINTATTGFTWVKPPRWAPVNLLEQPAAMQMPAAWRWHHDIRSYKYLLVWQVDVWPQTTDW